MLCCGRPGKISNTQIKLVQPQVQYCDQSINQSINPDLLLLANCKASNPTSPRHLAFPDPINNTCTATRDNQSPRPQLSIPRALRCACIQRLESISTPYSTILLRSPPSTPIGEPRLSWWVD
ncbi:hypothetical protein BD289DRAFT_22775 [Coniella lustricola]|uniref:Uncharacterized protein n=1 Tax=Coniella lustricola TaxID=2025994 RepID=A0A2T3A3F9_9PEZI|nr:hypothetical protein BD289DRAFT_22775 [Coniella lustricola]